MNVVDVAEFRERGYAVLKSFFSEREMAHLSEALERAKLVHKTKSSLDARGMKFYRQMFLCSAELRDFLSQQKIVDLVKPIVGPDFFIRWDQLVTKAPGGVEFPWHQDVGYNGLKDEYFQLWIAVTDITSENGNLWLVPGSHRKGMLPHTYVNNHWVWSGDDSSRVPVTARRGDVVLFSALMLHRTSPNVSSVPRVVYVAEYMSTDHFDSTIDPPYFQAARNGISDPKFVRFYKGNLSPANYVKHLPLIAKRSFSSIKERVRSVIKKV